MSDNIHSLFGGPVGDEPAEPDERIVEVLEEALARAKEGEIQDIVIVYRFGPDQFTKDIAKAWTAENFAFLSQLGWYTEVTLQEMKALTTAAAEEFDA